MRILFLHGWTSVPGGRKPTFLRDNHHEVLNPALPDEDFPAAVRIAEAALEETPCEIVVGSSRGGAVAMNMNHGSRPLVLLCPAWRNWGEATTVQTRCRILHSRADDVIPFEDSLELLQSSGLPADYLLETGNDHRLADDESLAKMLKCCELLA